jgi:competence protein ComEC
MKVHLIDVGQGAATLFEFSCGAVLVDTGGEMNGEFNSKDALQSYLDVFFDGRADLNRTIDLLVISHPHIDHARNARLVAEEYTVKNVVTDGLTTGSGGRQQKWLQDWAQANARLETVEAGKLPAGGKTSVVIDPIRCSDEDPRMKVLWGAVTEKPEHWSQADQKNGNNHSVVLRIDFGRASFLMTGDLEAEGISELLEKQDPKALDADVWQVSHHGSYNGLNQEFLDAITPSIALLGTSPPSRQQQWTAWAYGHPRKQATNLLFPSLGSSRRPVDKEIATKAKVFEQAEIERAAFATGWDGSVVVTANNQGRYWVETER